MADDPETTGGRIPDENRRIADRLSEYAALLEQQGEDGFRVRACLEAANRLERLHEPLGEVLRSGGVEALIRLPRVRRGIAAAIAEMLTTGRWRQLDRVKGEFTPESSAPSVSAERSPTVLLGRATSKHSRSWRRHSDLATRASRVSGRAAGSPFLPTWTHSCTGGPKRWRRSWAGACCGPMTDARCSSRKTAWCRAIGAAWRRGSGCVFTSARAKRVLTPPVSRRRDERRR
ncbi:Helix-hairpin-helix domain-containing protein [Tranquillimonas alkanivorans]|uniref:Helix-hairpin-helix domain-containing protein n=1 Tax=Tranquillimonas alkanivorans TaxID=441119 RepID=A0A1I5WKT2_9RHOB|nr:Helix-hairpin-helix domain-containing protein [Tranquillimonas alkanivorans]